MIEHNELAMLEEKCGFAVYEKYGDEKNSLHRRGSVWRQEQYAYALITIKIIFTRTV